MTKKEKHDMALAGVMPAAESVIRGTPTYEKHREKVAKAMLRAGQRKAEQLGMAKPKEAAEHMLGEEKPAFEAPMDKIGATKAIITETKAAVKRRDRRRRRKRFLSGQLVRQIRLTQAAARANE